MSGYRRVVWNEGMLLGPHHFQQLERRLLGEMEHRLEVARPGAYGVRKITIDEDALGNRRFHLQELEAVLPDGTLVRLPAIDPVPAGRDLQAAFGADRRELDVFLALPEDRPGAPRTSLPGGGASTDCRLLAEGAPLQDENAPGAETEILIAHQNLSIRVSGENLDGYTTLPIARLEKSEEGAIIRAPDWAPPSLTLQAAGPLPSLLVAILDNLSAKADALETQVGERGGAVQFGTSDVPLYWQLHTVNSVIPVIAHYARRATASPEEAYLVLAGLVGSLCTFAPGRHPREVPAYDPENLGPVFRKLETMIREINVGITSTRFERVRLERGDDDALLQGHVADERLLGSSYHWYLAVAGEISEDRIRDELPGMVTIGSSHNVEFLVRQALRGVSVKYTAVPPRDFPIKAGHTYFRLESHGETWDTVVEARAIAIYLRGSDLKGLSFELIVMEA